MATEPLAGRLTNSDNSAREIPPVCGGSIQPARIAPPFMEVIENDLSAKLICQLFLSHLSGGSLKS